jgi:hypothetical protein
MLYKHPITTKLAIMSTRTSCYLSKWRVPSDPLPTEKCSVLMCLLSMNKQTFVEMLFNALHFTSSTHPLLPTNAWSSSIICLAKILKQNIASIGCGNLYSILYSSSVPLLTPLRVFLILTSQTSLTWSSQCLCAICQICCRGESNAN